MGLHWIMTKVFKFTSSVESAKQTKKKKQQQKKKKQKKKTTFWNMSKAQYTLTPLCLLFVYSVDNKYRTWDWVHGLF